MYSVQFIVLCDSSGTNTETENQADHVLEITMVAFYLTQMPVYYQYYSYIDVFHMSHLLFFLCILQMISYFL